MYNNDENEKCAISIIIPVYNVEQWIDICVESLVNQTFSDFELLLINDGSTDDSGEKCKKWEQKDRRIIYIAKENEGPSIARNLGMQKAQGEYIIFVDSDDWVDERYLEKLYTRAIETDADFVECDIWRYNNNTGEKTYNVCYGSMGVDYTLEEHLKYGNAAFGKYMVRRKLLLENNITLPNCHSEARAIYALILALSNRVENVHEALYYYRRFREGSLTTKPRKQEGKDVTVGVEAFEKLIQGFQRCGLYEKYENLLEEIVKYKLSDLLAAFFYRRTKEEFMVLTNKYYQYVEERFPRVKRDTYVTLGGYNLNRVLWKMNRLHNPYCRFNFTSLISLMHPVQGLSCSHKNRYREVMVQRDVTSEFWVILDEVKPDYLFLDFIDERFDMIAYQGGYLTKSDAFEGAQCDLAEIHVIDRTSQECRELWEQSCKEFIDRILQHVDASRIVLIKNYLCEMVGNIREQREFDEIEQIRQTNHILRGYYDYFVANCKGVKVVEASECDLYFTDEKYEYGAIPSHLNEIVNKELAKMAESMLEM